MNNLWLKGTLGSKTDFKDNLNALINRRLGLISVC